MLPDVCGRKNVSLLVSPVLFLIFFLGYEVSGPPRSTIYSKILIYHDFGIKDGIQFNWDHFQI